MHYLMQTIALSNVTFNGRNVTAGSPSAPYIYTQSGNDTAVPGFWLILAPPFGPFGDILSVKPISRDTFCVTAAPYPGYNYEQNSVASGVTLASSNISFSAR